MLMPASAVAAAEMIDDRLRVERKRFDHLAAMTGSAHGLPVEIDLNSAAIGRRQAQTDLVRYAVSVARIQNAVHEELLSRSQHQHARGARHAQHDTRIGIR